MILSLHLKPLCLLCLLALVGFSAAKVGLPLLLYRFTYYFVSAYTILFFLRAALRIKSTFPTLLKLSCTFLCVI